jgi:hypothetical protein
MSRRFLLLFFILTLSGTSVAADFQLVLKHSPKMIVMTFVTEDAERVYLEIPYEKIPVVVDKRVLNLEAMNSINKVKIKGLIATGKSAINQKSLNGKKIYTNSDSVESQQSNLDAESQRAVLAELEDQYIGLQISIERSKRARQEGVQVKNVPLSLNQAENDFQNVKKELGILEDKHVQQDFDRLKELRKKRIEANKALSEAYTNKLPQDQIDALVQQIVELTKEIDELESRH